MTESLRFDFTRNADGTWMAIRDVAFPRPSRGDEVPIPRGTIVTPGVLFKGVDVGSWLEKSRLIDVH